jgi:serine/threonine protein phosphatase PrpC
MGKAHDAVNRSARLQHADARTVAVALLVQGTRADWVHAGDCRLYHFRAGKLLTRTRDDSVVQVLFENGEITEEEMGTHEDQNRLLQAIGGGEPPKPRHGSAVD